MYKRCLYSLLENRLGYLNNNKRFISNTTNIKKEYFNVLGIETSCDDTSIGIVRSDGTILGESKLSQWDIHKEHRGIVPNLASEQHRLNIDKSIDLALHEKFKDGLSIQDDIDVIAVTTGPGLAFSLQVGLEKAKELSRQYNKELCSVNHLEGHCLVVRMENIELEFPFLTLLISGGHSQILVCRGVSDYQCLGNTLDDSIGEALDKAARILDCEFGSVYDGHQHYYNIHGGEAIEILARRASPDANERFKFSIPMKESKNCDFSFSGLKSSLKRYVDQLKSQSGSELSLQDRCDLASSFQNTAFSHLENKLKKSLNWYYGKSTMDGKKKNKKLSQQQEIAGTETMPKREKLNGLVVSGGVSKNQYLRERLETLSKEFDLKCYFPSPKLCTDNGTMIAWAGVEMYNKGMVTKDLDKLFYIPYWPLDKNPVNLFDSNLKEKDQKIRSNWFNDIKNKYQK
ncbi:O-sialoglycoprotein endopeptidase [Tieghemostelium lacteum]|uniref:N(6)-L-threonylcarbamoyladenine synthase n=1 Tax=Tieghemostelium lacteum TaxID=361077 RepID=A0A151ZEQ4_TIELA|nr:O-sialoglycoprotein endopeptidase [Tieghemostelium lacteum]|eukprot:KYQ92405.1 O-sialoglycoprotein endopeptidase [Tieghemostelium lacteum]